MVFFNADAFVGGMIYGLLTYPDNDQKTLELVCGKRVDESSVASKINLSTLGK